MRLGPRKGHSLICGKVGDKEMLVAVFKVLVGRVQPDGEKRTFDNAALHLMYQLVCA